MTVHNQASGKRRLVQKVSPLPIRLLAFTLALLLGGTAHSAPTADGCTPAQMLHLRGFTLRLENDLFAGTDRNYTNGVSLALISHDIKGKLQPECLPLLLAGYGRLLNRLDSSYQQRAGADDAAQNLVLRFGQSMYTPEDPERHDLIRNDRPYAGLLYMGLAWNRRVDLPGKRHEMLETRELTLGVIGPAALARQTQNLVHDIRGLNRFHGWHNQLRNEPAFQLALERKYKRAADGAVLRGWHSDAISRWSLRLGNIETSASAGIEWRAGWNIPNDFGSYPIRAGAENRPPSRASRRDQQQTAAKGTSTAGAHVFANLELKAVAHDFSLDGNLFRSSHRVSRQPWVAQTAVGIGTHWRVASHSMRLAIMRVWRTREFRQQRSGHHAFGSIALSMDF